MPFFVASAVGSVAVIYTATALTVEENTTWRKDIMKRSKVWVVVGILILGLALVGYTIAKLPVFDTMPLCNFLSGMKSNYSARTVDIGELNQAKQQLDLLMQKPKYANEDEVKDILKQADSIINRIDLEDPTITAEDKAQAGVALTELQKSLDMAMSHYNIDKAEILIERVEIGMKAHTGNIGDILTVTPYLYPTFITGTVLDWTSSNQAVATVNEDGEITLVGAGSCTITVTENKSGVTSCVEIIVNKPVAKPPVNKPQGNNGTGGQTQNGTGGTQSGGNGSSQPYGVGDYDAEQHKKWTEDHTDGHWTTDEMRDLSRDEKRDAFKDITW